MPTKIKIKPEEAMQAAAPLEAYEEPVEATSCEQAQDRPARLTGPELLAFYNERQAAGESHEDTCFAAGYYTVTKSGQERVSPLAFANALLQAQGFPVAKPKRASRAGLSEARVSGAGMLLVSQSATKSLGAVPGQVFSLEFPSEGQILLTMTDEVRPARRRKGSEED